MNPRTSSHTPKQKPAPQALGRVLDVFHLLSHHPEGETLTGVSKKLALPKSSLFNILRYLTRQDYLILGQDRRYKLGPGAFDLAMALLSTRQLSTVAHPCMERLAERSGETVLLGSRPSDEPVAVYTDTVESRHAVRYTVKIGERREFHCSAVGKLILAFMPEAELEQYLSETDLRRITPHTITDKDALRREIRETRRSGLAATCEEGVSGASALGAPILDGTGAFMAGLVLAGPSARIRQDSARFAEMVRETAAAISRMMGYDNGNKAP